MYINFHRRSVRHPSHDYSGIATYLVTICTYERKAVFGKIQNGQMRLNAVGTMVMHRLIGASAMCAETKLDEWIIMPDHVHFILCFQPVGARATRPLDPTTGARHLHGVFVGEGARRAPLHRDPRSLSSFVGLFKSAATSRYRMMIEHPNQILWQRGYHERIIKTEQETWAARTYVRDNPKNWKKFD